MCKKRKVISIVLFLLSIVFIILGFMIRLKNAQSPHADFKLLDEETQVVSIATSIDDSLPESSMSKGTVTHGGEATYDISSGKLSFMFENSSPEQSDMVISLMYEDAELWQSGLICSGKGLSPEIDADINLDKGVYDCVLCVYHYDHITGEKSIFSLTADIKLVVVDSSESNETMTFH